MPTELRIHAVHSGGMKMTATNGRFEVLADYPLEADTQAAGMKPLELLLASLAACSGSVAALLLGRMGQPIRGLEVDVRGTRRDQHPTVFTHIVVEFTVRGTGVDPEAVERAIAQTEGTLAPVWAMLKASATIEATSRILEE